MKQSILLYTLTLLAGTTIAAKTCTPSFDYCADELIKSKGFTEADLKAALVGTEFENTDVNSILYHCTNPGAIGHPKFCASGCQDSVTEGSKNC
ncbi:hypothetical protein BDW67DRAFT_179575 [Aspergillus spinulosporus]